MVRLPVISLLGLLAVGCSWYAPKAALNPKYKVAGSAPGPARVLPILECKHVDHGQANERQRELFMATMPNELWKAAGMSGEPALASVPYSNPLCEEFYRDDNQQAHSYVMNARVQRAVSEALEGRPEKSLLVTTYFFPYRCEARTGTVSDAQGRAIGTVGTGETDCWESGGVQINTLLLTRTEVIWWMSTYQGEQYNYPYNGTYDDGPKVAASLFAKDFPHEVITVGTTVQVEQPTAEPAKVTPAKVTPTKTSPKTKKPARQARTRAPSPRNS